MSEMDNKVIDKNIVNNSNELYPNDIRLASFTEENPNPLIECDFLGNITYINPSTHNYMRRMDIEINEFIPKNHYEIVKSLIKSDYDYHIEIEVKNKVFSWIYHPVKFTGYVHIYGSDITEQKKLEKKLVYDALHDNLTGLPNRALFIDRLNSAFLKKKRKQNYLFAVLFLDLDRFKIINDSLGHLAGDELLIQLSKRLKDNIRPCDTIARMGGDEFTILLDDIKDSNSAVSVAKRIQKSLADVFKIGENEIFVTASIGIVLSNYESANKAVDFLRDADAAMYKAKINGKNRYKLFNTSMYEHAVSFLNIETDLWRAIERKEFEIYYQPVISLETNKIKGFEALVRWNHPEKGLIMPENFIKVAEETGLIVPIDLWTLNESCRQMKKWSNKFSPDEPFSLSVNFSGKHFTEDNVIQNIEKIITDTNFNSEYLKLEITEKTMMENQENIIDILDELKRLNIELMLDDFGTGYSSLSCIHKFPIHALKVDKSFVSSLEKCDNSNIIKTIIMFASSMKINIIAEGVETENQLSILKSLNCEFAQGFLFSKPLNSQQVENYLSNSFKNYL